jgi:hypothetical protein
MKWDVGNLGWNEMRKIEVRVIGTASNHQCSFVVSWRGDWRDTGRDGSKGNEVHQFIIPG